MAQFLLIADHPSAARRLSGEHMLICPDFGRIPNPLPAVDAVIVDVRSAEESVQTIRQLSAMPSPPILVVGHSAAHWQPRLAGSTHCELASYPATRRSLVEDLQRLLGMNFSPPAVPIQPEQGRRSRRILDLTNGYDEGIALTNAGDTLSVSETISSGESGTVQQADQSELIEASAIRTSVPNALSGIEPRQRESLPSRRRHRSRPQSGQGTLRDQPQSSLDLGTDTDIDTDTDSPELLIRSVPRPPAHLDRVEGSGQQEDADAAFGEDAIGGGVIDLDGLANRMPMSELLAALLDLRQEWVWPHPVSVALLCEALDAAGADAGCVLLPSEPLHLAAEPSNVQWLIEASEQLPATARYMQLDEHHWLVRTLSAGDNVVIFSPTTSSRELWRGAPLHEDPQLMAIPLQEVRGLLLLSRRGERPFTLSDAAAVVEPVQSCVPYARQALELRHLNQQLTQAAYTVRI